MAALAQQFEERVAAVKKPREDWLLATLLQKMEERVGAMKFEVKKMLTKYDRDGSGELDRLEFRSALEEHLHGVSDAEFEALFRRFDKDQGGSVSISEFLKQFAELGASAPASKAASHAALSAPALQARDSACGLGSRSGHEFVGHGEDIRAPDSQGDSRLSFFDASKNVDTVFMADLSNRLRVKGEGHGDAGLDEELLQRALMRHRASPAALCLTRLQLRHALADVFGGGDVKASAEALWHATNGGKIASILEAYASHHDAPPAPPPRSTRHAERLRNALLDKVCERHPGGSLHIALKRLLSKFDMDSSGELDRNEMKKLIENLVPGTPALHVDELIDDFDTDGSGTLSISECTKALVATQLQRDSTQTSLGLNKKNPLYTKQGARGT